MTGLGNTGTTGRVLEGELLRRIEENELYLDTIAFDLDGTLLDRESRLRPQVIDAVRDLSEAGFRVVLASGRPIRSVLQHAQAIGIRGAMVAANGALVADRSTVFFSHRIPEDHVHCIIGLCERFPDVAWNVYDGYSWGVRVIDANVAEESAILGFEPDLVYGAKRPLSAEKFLLIGPDEQLTLIAEELEVFRGALQWVRPKARYLEIMKRGGHKATGLQQLPGGCLGRTIAVGDSDNDLEMLEAAAIGIAMGNGTASARHAADLVIGSNANGGIIEFAQALMRFSKLRAAAPA